MRYFMIEIITSIYDGQKLFRSICLEFLNDGSTKCVQINPSFALCFLIRKTKFRKEGAGKMLSRIFVFFVS